MNAKSEAAIRDATSVVLVRDSPTNPQVLVGRRSNKAVFMPDKFVFPGGAVEPGDKFLKFASLPFELCRRRLCVQSDPELLSPLLGCAIREVWEETGLRLAAPSCTGTRFSQADSSWRAFLEDGLLPAAGGLVYFFRAVTPPGRSPPLRCAILSLESHYPSYCG